MKTLPLFLAAAIGLASCTTPETTTSVTTESQENNLVPAWAKSANIYEVNVRQYTPEGTLNAFSAHLPRLAAMNVDVLWFMPIQPIGELNRKGELGSYYSIKDYTAVNPAFGTLEDFKALVDQAHELGMHVILDWVANHSAWDHKWVETNDDFYSRDENGEYPVEALGNDGGKTGWTDVADLNYDTALLTDSMAAEMDWWVSQTGIDGFRCDMAGMVPYAFWEHTIPMLREKHGPLFFLAEWSEPHLMSTFNADYGWEFHHLMNDMARGHKTVADLAAYAAKNDSIYPDHAMKLYFTSNHDENSWQGSAIERMGEDARAYFALSFMMEQSLPLLYTGQEVGIDYRFPFFSKDTIGLDWSANTEHANFYAGLFALKHEHPALWNGAFGAPMQMQVDTASQSVLISREIADEDKVVGIFNFGTASSGFEAPEGLDLVAEVKGAKIYASKLD